MDINKIIEYDLNAGKFHGICSNETTFKKYINNVFKTFIEAEIERTKKIQNDTGFMERDLREYLADEIKRYEEVIKTIQ